MRMSDEQRRVLGDLIEEQLDYSLFLLEASQADVTQPFIELPLDENMAVISELEELGYIEKWALNTHSRRYAPRYRPTPKGRRVK